MFSQGVVAALLVSFFLTALASAQVAQIMSGPQSMATAIAGLTGKVLGADGHPASGIRIEVQDPSTAMPVTSTYTQPDGTFELYNIPQGSYEVIAESGDSEVSDQVAIHQDRPSLELRFPRSKARAYDTEATVSVASMLVPEKAHRIYLKAQEAFSRGKSDEARSLLDTALQVEPEFAEALLLRGLIEMQSQDLDAAQESLEHAVRIDPGEAGAYIGLGAVYNHEGRFDDAMRASEKGVSLSPRSWQAYFEMAKASIGRGTYQEGLRFARQAERLGGSSFASLHLVKACALYPLKLYKDAKHEVQAFLARGPNDTSAEQAKTLMAEINGASNAGVAAVH